MTKPFITDDFLLSNDHARELYHKTAKDAPILDYHCHLPPQDIAEDRQFDHLQAIWLQGDHYKWRAMRAHGIPESHITGEADPYDKFLAWAETVPHTLRNPLYHWTHLELKRVFGIDTLLNKETGPEIWEEVNKQLAQPECSARGILKHFKVELVGTTDDPADPLPHHEKILKEKLDVKVTPTYRPDKAAALHDLDLWHGWVKKLSETASLNINTAADLMQALKNRHDDFEKYGCRLSDHGIERAVYLPCTDQEAETIFQKARERQPISESEQEQFMTYLLQHVGRWNAEKNFGMQWHIGAQRNNRTTLYQNVGPDSGGDSIGDHSHANKLAAFLDSLDREGKLPKTIVYNLNPAYNYVFATMMGNFQDGETPGKMQFGSGWWFLDQLEGMEWQINALSNLGLLSHFIGMLTDSRSFLSFPRHEYFRRLLCNLLGQDMENGKLPNEPGMIHDMVDRICHRNARAYLNLGDE